MAAAETASRRSSSAASAAKTTKATAAGEAEEKPKRKTTATAAAKKPAAAAAKGARKPATKAAPAKGATTKKADGEEPEDMEGAPGAEDLVDDVEIVDEPVVDEPEEAEDPKNEGDFVWDEEESEALQEYIRKRYQMATVEEKRLVPWKRLTSWLKDLYERHGAAMARHGKTDIVLPPLDIMGATVARVVNIKKAKR